MNELIKPLGLFLIGLILIIIGGADGTWEQMSSISWTGLIIMNVGVLYSLIIGAIYLIKSK